MKGAYLFFQVRRFSPSPERGGKRYFCQGAEVKPQGSIEIVLIDGDAGKIRLINASYGEAPISYAEELMKNLCKENTAGNISAVRRVLMGQTPRPRYILRAAPLPIEKYGAKD